MSETLKRRVAKLEQIHQKRASPLLVVLVGSDETQDEAIARSRKEWGLPASAFSGLYLIDIYSRPEA